MALWLAHDDKGTKVTDTNPIQTRHSSAGEEDIIPLYLFNDGFRTNANDTQVQKLRYTNIKIRLEGVYYRLSQTLSNQLSSNTVTVDIPVTVPASKLLFNQGTVLQVYTSRLDASGNRIPNTYAGERMYVSRVTGTNTFEVTRDYQTGIPTGVVSSCLTHQMENNLLLVAETASVSLRLPYARDYITEPNTTDFLTGGMPLDLGIDPTELTGNITTTTVTTIPSSNGLLYKTDSIIKIDNEMMRVVSSSASQIQVERGWQSTPATHDAIVNGKQTLIYLVGLVDVFSVDSTLHKFWLKNKPPANLPTQMKKDIRVIIEADEEPLE